MTGRHLLPEVDRTERRCPDDEATLREGEFLAAALHQQAMRAAAASAAPGTCANCGERCLPQTVYCDADCRGDHERRLKVRARQGGTAR